MRDPFPGQAGPSRGLVHVRGPFSDVPQDLEEGPKPHQEPRDNEAHRAQGRLEVIARPGQRQQYEAAHADQQGEAVGDVVHGTGAEEREGRKGSPK